MMLAVIGANIIWGMMRVAQSRKRSKTNRPKSGTTAPYRGRLKYSVVQRLEPYLAAPILAAALNIGACESYLGGAETAPEIISAGVVAPEASLPLSMISTLLVVGLAQSELGSFDEPSQSEESAEPTDKSEQYPRATDPPTAKVVDEDDDSLEPGVIYARVSSYGQKANGRSLEDQVQTLRGVADQFDIDLVYDAIEDGAETGTDFDRPGIRKVWQLAKDGDISYVLVDDVDRIGRHAPECIFYIWELREEFDVRVVTTKSGELDMKELSGLIETMIKTLSAHMANENRARRAKKAQKERFQQKNWSAFFVNIPLGYQPTDDDWLEVNQSERSVVQQTFDFFLETSIEGAYEATLNAVGLDKYGVGRRQLKKMLRNPVYIGEATVGTQSDDRLHERRKGISVEDQSLQIISERKFERVQERMDKIYEWNSTGSSGADDVYDFIKEFGFHGVVQASACVQIRCPGCGGEVVKNGQRKTFGRDVHNYRCKKCGTQRKFPTQDEFDEIRNQAGDEQ